MPAATSRSIVSRARHGGGHLVPTAPTAAPPAYPARRVGAQRPRRSDPAPSAPYPAGCSEPASRENFSTDWQARSGFQQSLSFSASLTSLHSAIGSTRRRRNRPRRWLVVLAALASKALNEIVGQLLLLVGVALDVLPKQVDGLVVGGAGLSAEAATSRKAVVVGPLGQRLEQPLHFFLRVARRVFAALRSRHRNNSQPAPAAPAAAARHRSPPSARRATGWRPISTATVERACCSASAEVAPGAPYRTALDARRMACGNIDDHSVRALLRVVFRHLLQAPASPRCCAQGSVAATGRPPRARSYGSAGAISENSSNASGHLFVARPSNARPWALLRAGWLMLFTPRPRPSPPSSRRSRASAAFRAPQVQQDRHAHLRGAVEYLLAGGEDLLLLFGPEGQGIFAAPSSVARLGLLVAQAVEAGPGRVDPRPRYRPHTSMRSSPAARAVDVGVARRRSPGSEPTAGRPGCRRGWPVRTGNGVGQGGLASS